MHPLNPLGIRLDRSTLIEASAGTGKTYTIATLVLRLIAEGYPIESILVVTFTEAAAAELKLRIRDRLRHALTRLSDKENGPDDDLVIFFKNSPDRDRIEKRFALALTCFDQAAVMTIHSFCYKTLKAHSFESRSYFDMELVPDPSAFLKQAGFDFFMKHVVGLDPLFLNFLETAAVTPESFIAAFKKVLSRQDLTICPEVNEFADCFDEYRQGTQEIRQILENESETIIALIGGHKGLDKRSYTKKNVPNWLAAIREKLDDDGENPVFKMTESGDALYKFTRTRMLTKLKAGSGLPGHPFFDACEKILSLSDTFDRNLMFLKTRFIRFLRDELEKFKNDKGVLFFDDLVNDLAAALDEDESKGLTNAVRKKYQACLIDEFQDTDPRQYDIFKELFFKAGIPFFMIGDPKQAIYAFRGGDIYAYLKASRQAAQRFTLEKNYRSSPSLVNAVNQVFSNIENPFGNEDIAFFKVSTPDTAVDRLKNSTKQLAPLTFTFLPRDGIALDRQGYISKQTAADMIPEIVANDILTLMRSDTRLQSKDGPEQKRIEPGDIAVLVRTNRQAVQIQKSLADQKIPSFISKTGSVWDSVEAVELNDILHAVYEPDNVSLIRAALCSSIFNFDAEQIRKLDRDDGQTDAWHNFFLQCKTVWETKGFVSMIMTVLHSEAALLKPEASVSERGLTNFYHLVELISSTSRRFKFSPFYLIQWFQRQLVPSTRESVEDELRLESDKKAVAIVTIHKSKGLEYPVVYLPYAWEGRKSGAQTDIYFHDPNQDDRLTLDIGSPFLDAAKEYAQKEQDAEQVRLLYVAMTRASAFCKILWAGFNTAADSSLGRILHPHGAKDDVTLLNDLQTLAGQAGGTIAVEAVVSLNHQNPWTDIKRLQVDLKARPWVKQITPAWRMTSFSSLISTADGHASLADNDPGDGQGDEILLADFPKGPVAGDFFHAVLENLDFTQSLNRIQDVVGQFAGGFGFDSDTLMKTAGRAVADVIKTRLSVQNAFRLEDIDPDKKMCEMEFAFPVENLNGPDLKKAFGKASESIRKTGYPSMLAALSTEAVNGYLKGFIDLVVRHKGQYYIIDYKSNHLGRGYAAYTEDRIQAAMRDHHYFLQYHIYLLALHRYLSWKLADYDYETHIGGVFYLFIRGMRPESGPGTGVFFDRPSNSMIDGLSKICM